MKSSGKRFIYAGIFVSIFFVICFIFLDFSLPLSLVFVVVGYIGGVLFFKEKDVIRYDAKLITDFSFEASKLLNYNLHLKDEEVKQCITRICEISDELIALLVNRADKVTEIYHFFDYYLDIALDLAAKLEKIESLQVVPERERDMQLKIPIYFKTITQQFEKQLDRVHKNQNLDMQQELKYVEQLLPKIDKKDGQ